LAIDNGNVRVGLIRFSESAVVSVPLQQQNFTNLSGKYFQQVHSKFSQMRFSKWRFVPL